MIPSPFADVPPLLYTDSVDIPVLFRDSPAARPFKQWRTAKPSPWPATAGFPAKNGWYLPTTTWREILEAATEVGRDITPNLLRMPQLASSELVARVAPLYAYLGMHSVDTKHPLPGSMGRRLTVNPVYEYGTERSAKNALGYRLGMTMAEWATRSLMGLGQTLHIEDGGPVPALRDKFVTPSAKLPDLWGLHADENQYWMIEAKGGNVRSPRLWEGWKQLQGGTKVLHKYAHRRILVGASVQPQGDLFLTVDHDHHPGKEPLHPASGTTWPQPPGSPEDHLGDSDDALMGTARAQMLVYLALSGAHPSRLKTVALPADRTNRRRSARGVTTPLERDTYAHAMRGDVRAAFADDAQPGRREYARTLGLDDFLTYRVPGTELRLGMSRQLFAACAQLHREDQLIAEQTPGMRAEDVRAGEPVSEEAEERRRHTQRRVFREQQDEQRARIEPRVREAFEYGRNRPWRELLHTQNDPRLDLDEDPGLLEAATAETYLAVREDYLPHQER
ncbi:gamma-glutamyltransferase [Streptomyces goshikiensis]|uniref:gamma-glutamyltransferase n=1 Tax=Streptomyces goshikiensis TaxID=1942 RepID=UPI00386C8745|nr:gamma-glutamyltransferase [Streptomyces goshikiensis]